MASLLSLRRLGPALIALAVLVPAAAAQPFTFSLRPHALPAVYAGAASWADVDNDGDLDALVTGTLTDGTLAAGLYRNDSPADRRAEPVFVRTAALPAVAFPAVAWGDWDRDGDLDLLLAGSTTAAVPYAPLTRLYRNDGAGAFAAVDASFEALHSAAAAWGDVDNDGDLDLLLAGTGAADYPYTPATRLYRNDTPPGGAPAFTRLAAALPDLTFADAAWGDHDGDGDLDLALTGYGADGFIAEVFRNTGGVLAAAGAGLPGLAFGSVDWGDHDGDGDLDLALSGGRTSPHVFDGEAHVYRNDGGAFVRADLGLRGTLAGEAGWGDYDSDGDLDLLVVGATRPLDRFTARVYENAGGGAFEERTLLVGAVLADAAWGDYDGDGDLDLLVVGLVQPPAPAGAAELPPKVAATHLYRNDRPTLDTAVPAPAALRAAVDGSAVRLAWDAPAAAGPVTYALRVGTAPGAADVLAPAADAARGTRRLTTPGEAAGPAWTLAGLAPGTYHWSVQAVNAAFAGSAFAEGGAFTIGAATVDAEAPALPAAFAVGGAYPNPFADAVRLEVALPGPSDVAFRVYNLLGELVHAAQLRAPAGVHAVAWDGRDAAGAPVPSGVYVYQLRTPHGTRSGRLVCLR